MSDMRDHSIFFSELCVKHRSFRKKHCVFWKRVGSSLIFMEQRNISQIAWRGQGPRPTVLKEIKAFTVAEVLDLGRVTHTKSGITKPKRFP